MADTQAPSPLAAEASAVSAGAATPTDDDIAISGYTGEVQLQSIMDMVSVSLSEPYSVFTYRFFLHGWPQYCLLAHSGDKLVGLILCKAEKSKRERMRGYIAMLAVDPAYRKRGLGSKLVVAAVQRMAEACDEIVLETEADNTAALSLYERLGFIRDKRLHKYYMNGNDAFRLKVWLK